MGIAFVVFLVYNKMKYCFSVQIICDCDRFGSHKAREKQDKTRYEGKRRASAFLFCYVIKSAGESSLMKEEYLWES